MRIIALEEAFLHPKLLDLYPTSWARLLNLVKGRLTDVGPGRIRRMDAAGIDLQVLSHVQPGVQTLEVSTAIRLSTEINDRLADIICRYPIRFAGFATLATQSPQDASDELERSVTQLKFKGALINGHTLGRYMDGISFSPLFECAQALDVPIYIHPTFPPPEISDVYYKNYPAMAQSWGWMVETGTHLLRLMSGGVFDRYPNLRIIVGHMGELIPFGLDFINRGLTLGNWLLGAKGKVSESATPKPMQRSVRSYMRDNVFVTTSGVFDHAALACTIAELGIDHVLFSVDDPFGDNFEAVSFLKAARISEVDRHKLAHGNAERVLKLSTESVSSSSSTHPISAFTDKLKSRVARAILGHLVK
jgi:predicted TIM-barrel fold metal-dependent hydrolase